MDHELEHLIGERLKRLRMRSGLSLREQARILEIAPSALSAVENGRGGMSLMRLQRVAQYFGLTVSELLVLDGDESHGDELSIEVVRRGDNASSPTFRRGTGAYYKILGSGRGHRIQGASITFAPGGGYGRDAMGHEGEEFVFVVYGDIELIHGTSTYALSAGDTARFKASEAHAYRNASDTDVAHIIAAATPPW